MIRNSSIYSRSVKDPKLLATQDLGINYIHFSLFDICKLCCQCLFMNLWGKFLHLSWILALSVTTVSICKHLEASDLLKPLLQPPDRTVQQHSRLQARMQQCRNSIWHSSFYPGVTATPSSLGVGESWSLTGHLWPCHSSPEPSGWLLLLNHIRCELVALLSGPAAVLIPFPRQ